MEFSFVFQLTFKLLVLFSSAILEITGEVVSASGVFVMKLTWLEVAVFPDLSLDITTT